MSNQDVLRKINSIFSSTTILNFGALFTDVTPNFVSPAEPEEGDDITIKFRTAKNNVDGVDIVIGDERISMKLSKQTGIFDYY